MRLILLGPPGSGKGTIAKKLEKKFHLLPISAGEILREEAAKGTLLGKEIRKYTDKGNLVPDNLVTEIIKLEINGKNNFILDGFPRTLEQAKGIRNITIDLVIYLEADEKTIVERLSGRRICRQGHHTYNLNYVPSAKKGICDVDGTPLIHRKDDKPAVIKQRFKVYNHTIRPLLGYYEQKRILKKVNAALPPEEVFKEVKKVIKK